jgi:hypothetical protein
VAMRSVRDIFENVLECGWGGSKKWFFDPPHTLYFLG